jgi:hypothetical protein
MCRSIWYDIGGLFVAMSRSIPISALSWRHRLASLVVCLTLALLAGGLVIPHGTAEEHTGLPAGTHLDAHAQHPRAPLHMETAAPEVVHTCTACLLQTGRLSTLGRPAAVPLPLTTRILTLPVVERPDATPARRLGPARAPPASSPFA